MASLNNMQAVALNNSEKEDSRNNIANIDDDNMPAMTNAEYIAELKQRIINLEQQFNQMNFALFLGFFALLTVYVLNAKTYQEFWTF
ncbi:hypothetical protein BPAE_0297g00020 [Botrytis paeoniae]|uniref:Uncharacterized protein n=1 Tax=Botrytis paeoniae TaxID=278948 RepID=A0A4Z1FC99_9HELO|nr:hypothetical protein BPAE_0297g00020 [Botrytis paeoniae]